MQYLCVIYQAYLVVGFVAIVVAKNAVGQHAVYTVTHVAEALELHLQEDTVVGILHTGVAHKVLVDHPLARHDTHGPAAAIVFNTRNSFQVAAVGRIAIPVTDQAPLVVEWIRARYIKLLYGAVDVGAKVRVGCES